MEARAVETERSLKKSQETIVLSDSRDMTLTEKFSSLTDEMPSVRVKYANLRSDLYEKTALMQRMRRMLENSYLPCQQSYKRRTTICFMLLNGKLNRIS